MKKRYFSLLVLFTPLFSFGQISTAQVGFNNVGAMINDGGVLFNNQATSTAGYEVPIGSGQNAIYALSFWFGGTDINNQLKLSATTYAAQEDIFPGPSTVNTATGATQAQWPMTIFTVTQAEIDNHLLNFQNQGYQPPASFLTWPAHGDISQGFNFYLAPFVDYDQDGSYDPMQGDYPCIKGDYASYMIFNDTRSVHTSSFGDPLGIEVHMMIYQYASGGVLDNTTFVETTVINRGTQTLFDYIQSVFVDFDLGNYNDDYFGSDSVRNLVYAYNADAFDEDAGGALGYGATPPAIGVLSLENDFASVGGNAGTASQTFDYYQLMQGNDVSGTPWATPFQFNGNPFTGAGSNEVTAASIPGDRRVLANMFPDTMVPGSIFKNTYAVIFNQGVDNLESVNGLLSVADSVQTIFDGMPGQTCTSPANQPIASVTSLEELDFQISPNPSSSVFHISSDANLAGNKLVITENSGKVVKELELSSSKQLVSVDGLSPGTYFVTIQARSGSKVQRLIVQ